MLIKKSYSTEQKSYSDRLHIIGQIILSIAVFVFFAIVTGLVQIAHVIMKTGDFEIAMNVLTENMYYGVAIASIIGSYYSILLIFIIVQYLYKENIYSYLNISRFLDLGKTFKYLIIFILWMFFVSLIAERFGLTSLAEGGEEFAQSLFKNEKNLILLILAVGIIQPIFEEILFRGFLFKHLERKWGGVIAIICTSIVFSIIHFQYNLFVLGAILFPMAILLGIARLKTKSVMTPIIIHCMNNTITLVMTMQNQ